jgi:hypothetical protein
LRTAGVLLRFPAGEGNPAAWARSSDRRAASAARRPERAARSPPGPPRVPVATQPRARPRPLHRRRGPSTRPAHRDPRAGERRTRIGPGAAPAPSRRPPRSLRVRRATPRPARGSPRNPGSPAPVPRSAIRAAPRISWSRSPASESARCTSTPLPASCTDVGASGRPSAARSCSRPRRAASSRAYSATSSSMRAATARAVIAVHHLQACGSGPPRRSRWRAHTHAPAHRGPPRAGRCRASSGRGMR